MSAHAAGILELAGSVRLFTRLPNRDYQLLRGGGLSDLRVFSANTPTRPVVFMGRLRLYLSHSRGTVFFLSRRFVPDVRLLGGTQTPSWLWFFWHLGSTGMLFGYAMAEWRFGRRTVENPARAFAICAATTLLALAVSVLAVTVFHDWLPVVDIKGDFSRITRSGYAPLIQLIIVAALLLLWRATRFRTPMHAWLGVAMVALIFDNAITMAGGTRLSVGWYVGRINALLSAFVMLVLYLKEVNRGYLSAAAAAAELERVNRALETHYQQLETLVTERTRKLEDTQAALMHAQKLEAIGKLTGGVAHDFNNVLHIISGNLDLIKMVTPSNAPVQGRCNSAQLAIKRGAKLSSQLLSFARKQPLQPDSVSLPEVFGAIDLLLKRAVGERIAVQFDVADNVWNVLADPQQLENVMLNLAMNAADAMPEGGSLRIFVSNVQRADGDFVQLAFADDGYGMTPEVKARAFEPFFSTKGVGKGSGLGLSMAYGFVTQSGGRIDIDSAPGTGTSVNILLPQAAAAKVPKPVQIRSAGHRGNETILVVDDEPDIVDNVAAILRDVGYSVFTASSADEAVTLLDSAGRIDLLFTDVIMPGSVTATELAARARVRHPQLRVLFTSGYTENALIHNGRLDEGINLLNKPYDGIALAGAVRTLLSSTAQTCLA
jgi:signal transduction histidine kinase/CheY-like chemotaxis protein